MMSSILVALLATAALPAAASDSALQKRASTDGVYLATCWEQNNNVWSSQMPYYSNAVTGSQNGELPNDVAYVSTDTPIHWEGERFCATYSDTGVQFCSSIVEAAYNYAVGQFAGPGSNDYSGFNCFKDNGRQLFQKKDDTAGTNTYCFSRYYCFQVDQPEN